MTSCLLGSPPSPVAELVCREQARGRNLRESSCGLLLLLPPARTPTHGLSSSSPLRWSTPHCGGRRGRGRSVGRSEPRRLWGLATAHAYICAYARVPHVLREGNLPSLLPSPAAYSTRSLPCPSRRSAGPSPSSLAARSFGCAEPRLTGVTQLSLDGSLSKE